MKKSYSKPEITRDAYSEFESVLAGCNKVPNGNCISDDGFFPGMGSSYSRHTNL